MTDLTSVEAEALTHIDEDAIGRLLLELLAVPSITWSVAESVLQLALSPRRGALRPGAPGRAGRRRVPQWRATTGPCSRWGSDGCGRAALRSRR